MMRKIYCDACCNYEKNVGSYAVIDGENHYRGLIVGENLNSGYCEVYAIREALKVVNNTNCIIYNDNWVTYTLNFSPQKFEQRMRRKQTHKEIKKEVYEMYNTSPNVVIKHCNRKKSRMADKLARKTLKEYLVGNNE